MQRKDDNLIKPYLHSLPFLCLLNQPASLRQRMSLIFNSVIFIVWCTYCRTLVFPGLVVLLLRLYLGVNVMGFFCLQIQQKLETVCIISLLYSCLPSYSRAWILYKSLLVLLQLLLDLLKSVHSLFRKYVNVTRDIFLYTICVETYCMYKSE